MIRQLSSAAIFSFRRLVAGLLLLLTCGVLHSAPSDPWTRGTGLFNDIRLGALKTALTTEQKKWTQLIDYDVDIGNWAVDVYVPPAYDGTKPYGVMVYTTSDGVSGDVLQTASADKNLIWIAPRYVGNGQDYTARFGVTLLSLYRAKELFNIDPRRVYTSGKSGGARVVSALAFLHPEIIKGTAPSAGVCVPRLNEVTPDYIPKPTRDNTPETFYNYSNLYFAFFNTSQKAAIHTTARSQKLRSYIMGRENDYREEYFVESFHCSYEPQGQACFLYNAPGEHTDPSDAEMKEAIDYLDRDDTFPVNANVKTGAGGFSGVTNISQGGASAVEATSGSSTTYTLTPTLNAVAAAKTGSTFYWDNTNGSTVRWLWEVKNANPTNQKTCFGLWSGDETWNGNAPIALSSGNKPGILITVTQNGTQNRMVISARRDTGAEVVFYDGNFSFDLRNAYSTAFTSTQTGYLTGTGSPVEIVMDLSQNRWQLTFNGIILDGTVNSIATGTRISRDNRRQIFGYWNSAIAGSSFWTHDPYTSWVNTWSPFTKSIFTASTGALSGTGETPSPMELRYVIASDPGLPDPLPPGPTGITASAAYGTLRLNWNSLAGAASYTVKRGTASLGPYTTLATNVTGTSYTDATVQSGVLYYYTVSANTASGTTANGTESAAGLNAVRLRSTGGTATNGTNTSGNEGVDKAFDGTNAKWFNGTGATDWLQYRFAAGKRHPLSRYILTTGNDVPERDPKDWQVQGSNDGTNWTTLDTRTGQSFPVRLQAYAYDIPLTAAYEYYRLNITANGGATGIQLTELQFLSPDMVTPVIATPSNILVGTVSDSGEAVSFSPTATDDEDGPVTVLCNPPSGSIFPIGSTTVVCTASDTSGNHSQTSFTVTVNDDRVNDISPPAITTPADIVVPATSPAGTAVTFTASAFDVMDGARSTTSNPASGSVFPVGTTVVTTTASDSKGNTTSRTFNVTVLPFIPTRAWLKFDEASGTTAADATGNNWNGTLVGGSTWTTGKINNAVSFSGSANYATLPGGLITGVTDFTVSAWVKLNAVNNTRIFDFGTGTSGYMELCPKTAANGFVRYEIVSGGTVQQINTTYTFPTGVWTHVALTQSGTMGTLYINGTSVGTNAGLTLNPSNLGTTTRNYIGKSQWSSDPYLNGAVDDFRIIGQALTAQQVAALAAPPAAPTSLIATRGDASVSLNWGAVTGALSYNVKRSLVSGGPYAFVTNTTTNSITDTGLTNGTTYYYVVTALNAVTESLDSTQASATPLSALQQWRQTNFGTTGNSGNAADSADPDGDGVTNAVEFAAGTDPQSPSSALRVTAIATNANDFAVSFSTVAGKTYRLERSDTLQNASWVTVQTNLAGNGSVLQVIDAGGMAHTKCFYRLVVVP
jgi:hypothetical protein